MDNHLKGLRFISGDGGKEGYYRYSTQFAKFFTLVESMCEKVQDVPVFQRFILIKLVQEPVGYHHKSTEETMEKYRAVMIAQDKFFELQSLITQYFELQPVFEGELDLEKPLSVSPQKVAESMTRFHGHSYIPILYRAVANYQRFKQSEELSLIEIIEQDIKDTE